MTLQVTATRTAGDTYRFDVSGFDPGATTWTIDYGDGTAPVTSPVATTSVTHTYAIVGHHDYTVTVTAGKTPYAATLAALAAKGQAAQSPYATFTQTGQDPGNYEFGLKFTPAKTGMITAIKFWRTATSTATSRTVRLWDAATQTVIASAVTGASIETGSGWKTVSLDKAYVVTAGKSYTATWTTIDYVVYAGTATVAATDLKSLTQLYSATPGVYPPTTAAFGTLTDVVFTPFSGSKVDESCFTSVNAYGATAPGTFELGQRFTAKAAGWLTAIRWLKPTGDTATTHKFNVWNAAGVRLATATSTAEATSGWITVALPTGIEVRIGDTFQVSVGVNGTTYGYVTPPPTGVGSTSLTVGTAGNIQPPDTPPVNNAAAWYGLDVVLDPQPTLSDLAAVSTLHTLGDIPATSETVTVAVAVDVGPATIWATVIAGDPLPVIQVDTFLNTGPAVLRWQVFRDAAGESVPVWFGTDVQTAISFLDYTAPVGVAVSYRLVVTYTDYTQATATSNTVTITGTTGCFLTDPVTGDTVAITLVSWPERERQARRSVLEVLGRPDPVVLSDVHSTPAGVWVLYTATDAETAALLDVLLYAAVVVLRTQPGSSIASVTASVGDVTERRYSGKGGDARRLVVCNFQEIAPLPATALPLHADLAGLATLADTLGDLSLVRPTLLQLSQIPTNVGARDALNV